MPVLTNPFQGEKGLNLRQARWQEIIFATKGLTFAHLTDGISKGLRESVTLDAKMKTKVDVAGRLLVDYFDLSIKGKFFEASIDRIKNFYLLSKDLHQLRLKNQKGEYVSLVDDTGTLSTPVGSSLVGTKFKVVIDTNSRHIESESICRLTLKQAEWLVDNFGVASAGGIGGVAVPLTPEGYDPMRTEYSPAGIYKILIDDVNIGLWKDPKLELNFELGQTDDKGRPFPQFCEVKGEVTMMQVAALDLLATLEAAQVDVPIEFQTMAEDSIICNIGAASVTPDWAMGDKDMMTKLTIQGTIPYNQTEATPNGIDIGVTDPAILALNLVGYPLA